MLDRLMHRSVERVRIIHDLNYYIIMLSRLFLGRYDAIYIFILYLYSSGCTTTVVLVYGIYQVYDDIYL